MVEPFWKSPSFTVRAGVDTSNIDEGVQSLINSLVKTGGMSSFDVTSGYRDPNRNARAGGAKGSQHIEGKAVDISTKGWTDEQRSNFLKAAIDSGAKGIGIYPNGSFHFDTRETPTAWGVGGSYRSSPVETFPQWAQPHLTALLTGKVAPVANAKASDIDVSDLASEFYTQSQSKQPASASYPAKAPAEVDADALGSEFYTPPKPMPADPKATRVAEVEQPKPAINADGSVSVNNVGRAVARGVPIIGGVLNKLNAATNAAIAPVGNQFFSPDDQLKGETFAERYENSLRQQEGMDKAFTAQNPKTNTALEVAGAIGATIPAAATAAGARLLGVTGPSLGARALASAKSGAAIGAIDNYIRTGDANEAARAGITGGVLGGAIPYVAAGAGAVARKGMELASPVATRTVNKLGEALKYSGSNIDDLKATLSKNPRIAAVDADDHVKALAQGLAAQPGEAQSILRKAVGERASGAKEAVRGVFDESLGPTPNVPQLIDTLKTNTKTNANKAFTEALKNAKPIELPEGEFTKNNINKIRETWDSVVSDIGDPTKLTQPELLHRVQSKLGEEARDLAKSAVGSERTAGREIEKLRHKIIGKLDESTGGKFKPAQAQYADDKAIEEAFDKGTSIFKSGGGNANRPDFFAREFAKASEAEKEAIRLGARTAVDNMIGQSKRAASTGTGVTESEFNLAKLKTILGDDEANRLAKLLKDEIEIAKTNTALLGGSQTEIRRGLAQSVAPRDVNPINQGMTGLSSMMAGGLGMQATGNLLGATAAAAPIAISAVRNVSQRLGRAIDTASNKDLAQLISASGVEGQRALRWAGERLAAQNKLSGAVNNATTAIGRAAVPEVHERLERSPLMITVRKKFTGGGD